MVVVLMIFTFGYSFELLFSLQLLTFLGYTSGLEAFLFLIHSPI